MKNIYVNSPPSIVEWSYQFGSSKEVFWEVLAKTAWYTMAICIAKYFMSYTDCKPLKTTTNYDFMYYYVYVLLSQLFMYLFTILCMYIYIRSAHGAYIHSFSVIFHHLSVHVNIRSAHCPYTYSLAVYIYNTWEDIIIYAFCLFVYIERIFLSKKSRQKRLPRINCTKLCQVWKGGIYSLKVKKVSVNKGVLMSSQTSNSLIQVVDLYLSLCCLF